MVIRFFVVLILTGLFQSAFAMSDERRLAIATNAYVYFYPLVTMDVTRNVFSTMKTTDGESGGVNKIQNYRAFPDASFRAVVRPNFDTLYSIAWIDLSDGPVVLAVPPVRDRYFMLELLDMWTDAIAVPGTGTIPIEGQDVVISPPGWSGDVPATALHIMSTTRVLWMIGRTQTNGVSDYPAVHKIQDRVSLKRLDGEPFSRNAAPSGVDTKTAPLKQVESMSGGIFFEKAFALLAEHGAHASDWDILQRMNLAGISANSVKSGELDELLEQARQNALKMLSQSRTSPAALSNGWLLKTDGIGVYGNNYFQRAYIAKIGLGANPPDWAVYPVAVVAADDKPLTGDKRYNIHFTAGELPPVDGFWSITMYDAAGFQIANPIDRYAIGDRDQLVMNDDGSLDIWIQPKDPGGSRTANWLPSLAQGELGLTMRLYGPREDILSRHWLPPAIKVAN